MADANYSQLVTVKGLNKVWNDGVIPLYNKLDHRLDNIGKLYTYKGTKESWGALKTIDKAEVGDAYLVASPYPIFPDDPDNYPAETSTGSNRMFICVQTISGTAPSYSADTDIDDENHWTKWWNPVNLNLNTASADNWGIVKLGYTPSNPSDRNSKAVENEGDRLKVVVPTSAKGIPAHDGEPEVPAVLGMVTVGKGINLSSEGEISLSVADPDSGLFLSDDGVLSNTGVKSLSNVVNPGTPTKLTGNLTVDTAISDLNNNDNNGKITFADGAHTFDVKVSGWSNKQNTNTAVIHTANTAAGSSSLPIYVNDSGVATAISTISLSGNGNVASFTDNDKSNSAVTITGKTVDNSVTQASLDSTSAALKVTGGIVCTSGIAASKVYHAVWNDISDAIEVQDTLKTDPGYCYFFDGKEYHRTDKYCQKGIIGIHSDTAGSVLGRKGKHKELDISIGGFVLAYVDKEYAPGTPLTSASNGRLTKMSLISRILHPERLVATYWKKETNKEWGDETHKVEVNGRHWVKVK